MGRPPLPVGSWGKIARKQYGPSDWVAYARYRDHDGVTRTMERAGATAGKAETSLKEALVDRLRLEHDGVGADSRLADVAALWFADEVLGQKAENTEIAYRRAIELMIRPGLGGLRLREISVGTLDRFLKALTTTRGPGSAKLAKSALSGILGMAARLDAIASNPLRDVAGIRKPKKDADVRVLDLAELRDFRAALHGDVLAQRRDLVEPIDYMIGTGARIGEALALRTFDLTLGAEKPRAVTRATIVRGRIQEHPKSEASTRELYLPAWLADELQERLEVQPPNDLQLVFPSIRNTPRDPNRVRAQFREWREVHGYDWVTPHVFRKSVATMLADGGENASGQLGHADERTTKVHYIRRTHQGPDATHLLDEIGKPADTQRKPREAPDRAGTTGKRQQPRNAEKAG